MLKEVHVEEIQAWGHRARAWIWDRCNGFDEGTCVRYNVVHWRNDRFACLWYCWHIFHCWFPFVLVGKTIYGCPSSFLYHHRHLTWVKEQIKKLSAVCRVLKDLLVHLLDTTDSWSLQIPGKILKRHWCSKAPQTYKQMDHTMRRSTKNYTDHNVSF